MDIDMRPLEVIDCCRPLGAPSLEESEAQATADVFKALGDPARVKIVNQLARADEAVCACEIAPGLGLSQATVSHHLKKLTDAGLLDREQRGKWVFFSLNPVALSNLESIVRIQEVVR